MTQLASSAATPSNVAAATEHTDAGLRAARLYVPLTIVDGGIGFNDASKALLEDIGGIPALVETTNIFYQSFWADQYLKQFLGKEHTPIETHAQRIAMYVAEQMGGKGQPWTADTTKRSECPHLHRAPIAGGKFVVVDSRADAHFASWNSVTRPADRVGRRFKLDDCRVWMRLMFWACRKSGVAQHAPFFNYFQRWIGHFIPIYEQTARVFVRNEARWSANAANIDAYIAAGRVMTDVIDVPYAAAIATVPQAEALDSKWPYG